MVNKLDAVSIKLVKGLVSSSVEYWKARISSKEIYGNKNVGKIFDTVNPVFEIAEALEMDLKRRYMD